MSQDELTDEYWMRIALEQALEAFARGDWPTGAAIVRDGQLLSVGQNRQNSLGNVTVHAEIDAIGQALSKHGPGATDHATLYSTMEPCPMCAGALKIAGIGRLVMAVRHKDVGRPDLGRYSMESFSELTGYRPQISEGVLRQECLALRRQWGGDPPR